MRKLLVSFLNGSLKYHADVIAGRQIHQIYNESVINYLGMYIHLLIVKCCYSMECLRKMWSCMRRSLHPRRCCVSCRFCQNSFCHFYQPLCALEKKFLVDMDKESPGMRVKFWNSLLLEIMAKLMKMRRISRHRRWGCRCCFWCSRVGDLRIGVAEFHFLRDFPGNGLEGLTLSECVFDTARPPQCEFSNLYTSIAFGLLE